MVDYSLESTLLQRASRDLLLIGQVSLTSIFHRNGLLHALALAQVITRPSFVSLSTSIPYPVIETLITELFLSPFLITI